MGAATRTPDPQASLQRLLGAVQEASLDQFRIFAKRDAVRVEPATTADLPFRQQMTHIMIMGPEIELSFKTHFMTADALAFTNSKLGGETASRQQGIDFMKEFCNIVAGKTKKALENAGFVVGQSLPFAIQGYNEIFYPRDSGLAQHGAWHILDDQAGICCSTAVVVRTEACLERLSKVVYVAENRETIGEVELF